MTLPPSDFNPVSSPGVFASDSPAVAGAKILRIHFDRLLSHEPGVLYENNVYALHQMRVASRRMRVALDLFGPSIDPDAAPKIRKGLRRTRRVLGPARDLDVFWEKVQLDFGELSAPDNRDLSVVGEAWKTLRDSIQDEVHTYLQSEKYLQFKDKLQAFVDAGLSQTDTQTLAVAFASDHILSEYQRVLDSQISPSSSCVDEYHKLRIAFKKFRYTIEFFEEILGASSQACLFALEAIQDHLGDLNDARVAIRILNFDFQDKAHPVFAALLDRKQDELSTLMRSFPELWDKFRSPSFKENLMTAISEVPANSIGGRRMKTLLILRHGKSSWDQPELSDHDRPLKNRGRRDAPRMGELIADEDLIPDLILSSTAKRAKDTASLAAEACGFEGSLVIDRDLYHAGEEDYVEVLQAVNGDPDIVMVVGHNPGLEILLEFLTGESEWLPTCSLAQVELPIEHWRQLDGDVDGKLVNLWRPRELS